MKNVNYYVMTKSRKNKKKIKESEILLGENGFCVYL